MMRHQHDRFESLAGAIALGEASAAEREQFEAHLAGCVRCREQLGSSCELQRVRNIVANARESETWAPDMSATIRLRVFAARRRGFKLAFGLLGTCAALSCIVYVAVGSGFFTRVGTAIADPPTISYLDRTIVVAPKSVRDRQDFLRPQAKAPVAAHPSLPVQQTVVVIAPRPSIGNAPTADRIVAKAPGARVPKHAVIAQAEPQRVAPQVGAPALSPPGGHSSPAGDRFTGPSRVGAGDAVAFAQGKQSAANFVGSTPATDSVNYQAKSGAPETIAIAPSYVSRDPAPELGDRAIAAEYSPLALAEGAHGTVGVEVSVDATGNAIACSVVQSSGYLVLDELTCKAVKKVHYRPAMTNGQPVSGTFRFSRTFSLE